ALAADPDIILMDEPFSALDPISREQLQKDIRVLQTEIKKTIIFVTHDMDEAMALGDKICLMKEGQVVQIDAPQQLILHPETSFVKDFIGERKSPWQTAVDVICNLAPSHVLSVEEVGKTGYPERGMYVIRDKHHSYIGMVSDGKKIKAEILENDMTLFEAAEKMETETQNL